MPAKIQHHYTRPAEIKARDWNNIVREAFFVAGYYWVQMYALKHFEPGAAQRYQMPARTEQYRRRRAGMAKKRGEEPSNLVWSGQARAIARARANYPPLAKVNARATSNKQYVVVPIPIGHPIPGEGSGKASIYALDFGKLTNDEMFAMQREAKASMERSLFEHWKRKETIVIGAAA